MHEGESAALAGRVCGRPFVGEAPVTVDQTNHSVVVGGEVVVKWLVPPVPAPHPGVELLAHLAHARFDDMPPFLGAEERDGTVVALVTGYLPGAQDGWDWFVDDVDAGLREGATADGLDTLASSAARMGALTARLHVALSTLQRSTVAARLYHAQAVELLDRVCREVTGEECDRLRAAGDAVVEALRPLDCPDMLTAHRIHGDLHAGQFLRSGDRLVVTDFDGNPLADPRERRMPQSPLRDLASLLQSLDHVGRIVVKRRHPDRGADVDRFIADATQAALTAYRADRPVRDDLLAALRVAQELHEFHYAVTHLPRWLYVPDAALPALL